MVPQYTQDHLCSIIPLPIRREEYDTTQMILGILGHHFGPFRRNLSAEHLVFGGMGPVLKRPLKNLFFSFNSKKTIVFTCCGIEKPFSDWFILAKKSKICGVYKKLWYFLSLADVYRALPEPPDSQIQGWDTGRWCDHLHHYHHHHIALHQ